MWRFVLRENISRFRTLLATEQSAEKRGRLRKLLKEAEEELDELEQASTPLVARRDEALRFYADQCVEDAVRLHAAQFSALQIYDDARERLIILAQVNFQAPFLLHLSSVRRGDGSACGRCLETGAPAVVEDVKSNNAFQPHRKAALEAGFEAVHASPVTDRSEALIAVLSTYFTRPRRFSEDELSAMARYAARIGPDLERRLAAQRQLSIHPVES
jgi:GAF domain-containing protein